MFMEELNLISAPLQLRMLWKILRYNLLLFLKPFVISQLFCPIFYPERALLVQAPGSSTNDYLPNSLIFSYIVKKAYMN